MCCININLCDRVIEDHLLQKVKYGVCPRAISNGLVYFKHFAEGPWPNKVVLEDALTKWSTEKQIT